MAQRIAGYLLLEGVRPAARLTRETPARRTWTQHIGSRLRQSQLHATLPLAHPLTRRLHQIRPRASADGRLASQIRSAMTRLQVHVPCKPVCDTFAKITYSIIEGCSAPGERLGKLDQIRDVPVTLPRYRRPSMEKDTRMQGPAS